MPGFRSLALERCIERPSAFSSSSSGERPEDHTAGFRGLAAYEEWRRLLHRFYDPFPKVEHFTLITEA